MDQSTQDPPALRTPRWRCLAAAAALWAAGSVMAAGVDPAGTNGAPSAERGRGLLQQFGCGSCHRIPGVRAARGNVGPPLERFAQQVYVAGLLPNTPAALARFIAEPQAVSPGSAMPDLGVEAAQARDIAAYLLSPR
ncbi:c-type cytochrome [Piscinibacter sakaiensis]|uniref:c-type cytochrome n=1 Tax=Piscinibacter sakaiensis TaxID=1547922 RepID=UPI0012FBF872|nr:c-type cytochrome [Piscinibacter sakaiensis]